jgi:hypothetical protein
VRIAHTGATSTAFAATFELRVDAREVLLRSQIYRTILAALRMTSVVRKKVEADGLALTHARWQLVGGPVRWRYLEIAGRGAPHRSKLIG